MLDIVQQAKDIAEMVRKYQDQDLYERIIALREDILGLREDNLRLKEENKTLSDAANIQHELMRVGNEYYRKDDTQRKQPYCMTCWDYEHKLVNLHVLSKDDDGEIFTSCHICHSRKGT
jgi:hypothetical protein